MIYTEADYLVAKLKGETDIWMPMETTMNNRLLDQLFKNGFAKIIEANTITIKVPNPNCECWLACMNRNS